jgi:hypothetical protein
MKRCVLCGGRLGLISQACREVVQGSRVAIQSSLGSGDNAIK